MKITVEPTHSNGEWRHGLPYRAMTGETESGIPVTLFVIEITVPDDRTEDFLTEINATIAAAKEKLQ